MDMATLGAKVPARTRQARRSSTSPRRSTPAPCKFTVEVDGEAAGLAAAVQERDPQPPHGDRALRRRGHLHRRRDPRPALRPGLCLSGRCASPARQTPAARERDAARQAAPAEDLPDRRGGLFLLRQPDRPCHRPWSMSSITPATSAKRMEIGAVVAAAPADNVRRERPAARRRGDPARRAHGPRRLRRRNRLLQVAQRCSRSRPAVRRSRRATPPRSASSSACSATREATRMIKRCNDFGAGGVSVAIGELADGLDIDLDAVPKKYEGLDGTELAISESQERMAVVVAPEDAGALPRPRRRREPRGDGRRARDGESAAGHALEWQDHCGLSAATS